MNQQDKKDDQQATPWTVFLAWTVVAGLVIGAACGYLSRPSTDQIGNLSRAAAALFAAAAALFSGGLLGFLFGIPISRTKEDDENAEPGFGHNTNLEQVSDWLTKILIGVTLTQFNDIVATIWGFAAMVGPTFLPTFGGPAQVAALSFAYLIFFGICGFLFGYLWSQLRLIGLFNSIGKQVREQIEKQLVDSRLVEQVEDYLAGTSMLATGKLEELLRKIQTANERTRANIFYRTRRHRIDNRPDCKKPDLTDRESDEVVSKSKQMERAIEIFEALNAADPNTFHRNYAQIGFILKDACPPRHASAVMMFRKAIDVRGPEQAADHSTYEMALAECLIVMDRDPAVAGTHTEEIKALIERSKPYQKIDGWHVVNNWLVNPSATPNVTAGGAG